jgi:hypothetical protein
LRLRQTNRNRESATAQEDQASAVIRTVEAEAELQARMEAEARSAAAALINRYIDSHSRIVDLASFLSALTAALKAAREQGQVDASGELGRSGVSYHPKSE